MFADTALAHKVAHCCEKVNGCDGSTIVGSGSAGD